MAGAMKAMKAAKAKAMKAKKVSTAKVMTKGGLTGELANSTELKKADISTILNTLAEIGTKEVKKSGKFVLPGLVMFPMFRCLANIWCNFLIEVMLFMSLLGSLFLFEMNSSWGFPQAFFCECVCLCFGCIAYAFSCMSLTSTWGNQCRFVLPTRRSICRILWKPFKMMSRTFLRCTGMSAWVTRVGVNASLGLPKRFAIKARRVGKRRVKFKRMKRFWKRKRIRFSYIPIPGTLHDEAPPPLRGGTNHRFRRNDKGDSSLLDALSKLLQNNRPKTAVDDTSLIQSLQTLINRAQKQEGVDLWKGLLEIVENEKQRRQTKANSSQWPKIQQTVTRSVQLKNAWTEDWQVHRWKIRSQDWESKNPQSTDPIKLIEGVDDFAAALEQNQPKQSYVVLLHDSKEYLEATRLAEAEQQAASAVLLLPTGASLPDEHKHETARIPGTLNRALQIRLCHCKKFGKTPPALKTRQELKVQGDLASKISQAKQPNTTNRTKQSGWVVRFFAPGQYQQVTMKTWRSMSSTPGASARQWAQEVTPQHQRALGDTFRFELQDNMHFYGLMRVFTKEAAIALLTASGTKDALGQRWFVDTFDPIEESFPNQLLWIDAKDGEGWDDFATRVRRLSTHGVVQGRNQLAIRVQKDDTRVIPRPAVWRVDHIPPGWDPDMITQIVEELGFKEVTLLEKQRRNRTTSWLVRAISPGPNETFQPSIRDDNDDLIEISITKEAKRKPQQRQVTEVKQERRIRYDGFAKNHFANYGKSPTPPVAADEEMKEDDKPAAEEAVGDKRTAEDNTNQPVKKKKRGWLPKNAQIVTNEGAGNCLFLAVAQALMSVEKEKKKRTGRQIRQFVAEFMNRHAQEYEALWDEAKPITENPLESWNGTFTEYLTAMRTNGTWGTYLECFALSHALQRNILVLNSNKNEVWNFRADTSSAAICLLFSDEGGGHYEFINGDVEDDLWAWAKEHTGRGSSGQKGGAKSLALTDFASTNATPRKNLKRPRSPANTPRLTDFGSKASKSPKPLTGKKASFNEPKETWCCNICHMTIGAETRPLLHDRRKYHIKSVHKDMPAEEFDTLLGPRSASLFKISNVPWALRSWTCSNCMKGLPKCSESIRRTIAIKHLKECTGRDMSMNDNFMQLAKKNATLMGKGLVPTAKAKIRRTQMSRLNAIPGGHELVENRMPIFGGSSRFFISCKKCLARWYRPSNVTKPCQGHKKRLWSLSKMAVNTWPRWRRQYDSQLAAIVKSWNLTRKEVDHVERRSELYAKKKKQRWGHLYHLYRNVRGSKTYARMEI